MTSEQHLGDSLAALIDGELSHDHRERVLSHLVTCRNCKAEVEAQRALKNAFARSPLPAPPAALLARLQGLPGASADGPPDDGGPGWPQEVFPAPRRRETLLSVPLLGGQRGFPIHRPGGAESRESGPLGTGQHTLLPLRGQRGHRFAFAAAGAFSLAAVAISGALFTATPGSDPSTSGGTPVAMAASGGSEPSRSALPGGPEQRLEELAPRVGTYLNAPYAPVSYLTTSISPDMAALLAARQNALASTPGPSPSPSISATAAGERTAAEDTDNTAPALPEETARPAGADREAMGVMIPR